MSDIYWVFIPFHMMIFTVSHFISVVAYTFNYYANTRTTCQGKQFQKFLPKGSKKRIEVFPLGCLIQNYILHAHSCLHSIRIGIRSEDLQDFFEKTLRGSSIALSSPRLVFPAAIYGLWELSQHFAHNIFDFQVSSD